VTRRFRLERPYRAGATLRRCGDRVRIPAGAALSGTTGALAELAGQLERASVDATRFRPNLVLEALRDPVPGQELRIGDVVLRVVLPTPRCVVPGLEDEGPAVDRQLVSALARHHRAVVGDLGRAACFGVYAEVLRPGQLTLGQVVGSRSAYGTGTRLQRPLPFGG